jgi:Zn-dependent M16 (insulinase) family peptidase
MPNRIDESNGNGPDVNRIYTDALTAQLGERVTNLNRRQSDLETEMRSGFKQIESSMTSMSSEMRSAVAALSTNMAERNKPQWQALGVALTFATILGALAYWPIQSSTTDLKTALANLSDKIVTQKEMEWRTTRGQEDRARMEANVADIRAGLVPRAEHERVWQNYTNKDQDLQRQVDELKQAQGNVYGARDVILDLRERLDRVERQRLSSQP